MLRAVIRREKGLAIADIYHPKKGKIPIASAAGEEIAYEPIGRYLVVRAHNTQQIIFYSVTSVEVEE